jgi:ABC-2 type transport system ATP-binding protein
MSSIISVSGLNKTYSTGLRALEEINLDIHEGEIFALLGPNGAGKTTLIGIVCGIVTPTSGRVLAAGYDIVKQYRAARSKIGLVPQELHIGVFDTVLTTVRFSRGLFGCAPDDAYLEKVLRDLSLWGKRHDKIMTLSGGMKRRVMIAKALSHEPEILFLDEPTAGVDVELRRDMWQLVRRLRESGVTIILTTHYIEEAEQMADRIGVINHGKLIVVEEKTALMKKLGKNAALGDWSLQLKAGGNELEYTFDTQEESTGIPTLLRKLNELGIGFSDLHTEQSSLEDIFVSLIDRGAAGDKSARELA